MGRGSSGASKGGSGGGGGDLDLASLDYPEAFAPGTDFEASGDVDHPNYYASWGMTKQWREYADQYGEPISSSEEAVLMKSWDHTGVYGYVRTTNSGAINKALYSPENAGKSVDEIFSAANDKAKKRHVGRDLQTVKTLDNAINTHVTPADASYTRFCSPNSLRATYGLTPKDMAALQSAGSMTPKQLRQLSQSMKGSIGHSRAYTSTSGNRSANAFKDPTAKQSTGWIFERRISVPKGTHAYAARKNAQESEVIFGRGMQTRITGVSIAKDGHIIIHEMYDGYHD
jgi:hypothetical protein